MTPLSYAPCILLAMSDGVSRGGHKRSSKSPQPAGVFPTFDEIARLAHDLYAAGRQGGTVSIFECWRRAEDELLNRAAARATRRIRD